MSATVQGRLYWREACQLSDRRNEVLKAELAEARRELKGEIEWREQLQAALRFWMPRVPETDHPAVDRIADDAYLLVSMSAEDEVSAEALGWIRLAAGPIEGEGV